jgi:hypothetical protein
MVIATPEAAHAQRLIPAVTAPSHSVPATGTLSNTVSQSERRHSSLRYPLIGAAVGAIGFELIYLSQCRHDTSDGCMGGPAPAGVGFVVGAVAGGLVELVRRAGGAP